MRPSRPVAITVICVFWILFAISFVLPVYHENGRPNTAHGTPLNGWQAMVDSFAFVAAMPFLLVCDPRFLIFVLLPIANICVLIIPIFCFAAGENSWPFVFPLLAFTTIM